MIHLALFTDTSLLSTKDKDGMTGLVTSGEDLQPTAPELGLVLEIVLDTRHLGVLRDVEVVVEARAVA